MISFTLKRFLKIGMSYAQSPLDKRRIALFNYLIVFCVVTSILLGVITLAFGLVFQPILCLVAAVVLSVSWWFNSKGWIRFSKGYFISFCVLLISGASLIYIKNGQDVDLENMLFAAMAISMFLIDGFKKHLTYWLIFACFLTLKVLSLNAQGIEGTIFGLTLINNIVVSGVLYLFLYVFRSILIKTFNRSNQQERTLRSLLDNAPLLMALVDSEGEFILVNRNS